MKTVVILLGLSALGCNGNRNVENAWGWLLRQWGYATFNVDSFRGRGLTEVCTQAWSSCAWAKETYAPAGAPSFRAQLDELMK